MKEQLFNENIKRICRNDKEGLRQIYEDYCPMVYSAVWEVLCNRQDAEDVTSEFFIRLWDIADTYRPGKGHRAWLLTIAHNMAIDYLRKQNGRFPRKARRRNSIPDRLLMRISSARRLAWNRR